MIRRITRSKSFAACTSLAVLGILFASLASQIDLGAMLEVWRRISLGWFCLALLAMWLMLLLATVRFHSILQNAARFNINLLSLFRIQMISLFVAHGTPVAAVGEVARAALMKLRFNLSVGDSVRMVLYDRVIGALSIVSVGTLVTLAQLAFDIRGEIVGIQAVLWGGGIALVIFLIGTSEVPNALRWKSLQMVVAAVQGLGNLLRRSNFLLLQLIISLLFVSSAAAVLLLLAISMQLSISPVFIVLFTPLILFVNSLPIFYLGWGGREAVIIATLSVIGGMAKTEAVALSVAYGVVVLLAALPGGLFWALRPSIRKETRALAVSLNEPQFTGPNPNTSRTER